METNISKTGSCVQYIYSLVYACRLLGLQHAINIMCLKLWDKLNTFFYKCLMLYYFWVIWTKQCRSIQTWVHRRTTCACPHALYFSSFLQALHMYTFVPTHTRTRAHACARVHTHKHTHTKLLQNVGAERWVGDGKNIYVKADGEGKL